MKQLRKLEATIKNNQNPLYFPITKEELVTKIQSLKAKKACGPDRIRNEMLKSSSLEMQTGVLKLFNIILKSGHFPSIWNQGIITPIYKNGDKCDPNNYRGICVSSNLGKLFCISHGLGEY